jgi:hypothetical protein
LLSSGLASVVAFFLSNNFCLQAGIELFC